MISISKSLSFLIVLLTLISVNPWSLIPIGNYFTNIILYSTMTFLFIKGIRPYYDKSNNENLRYFHFFLIWIGICALRGMFAANGYWDWKNLVSGTFIFALLLSFYIFTNEKFLQISLKKWIYYGLILFLPVLLINKNNLSISGLYLSPVILLVVFVPVLKLKWKIALIFITLFVIFSDFGNRSSVLKFSFSLLLIAGYYIGLLKNDIIIRLLRRFLLILPFLLLILGFTGVFNIFQMHKYIGSISTKRTTSLEKTDQDLTADTRTFIYLEVISSAIKHNYLIGGRSLAKGNDSAYFGKEMGLKQNTGRFERFQNEVGILNIFTWAGLIGTLLYFLIFLKASYLAIYESKNNILKILGILVSFRWFFSFVEDCNNFDITNLTIWMTLAICYSRAFREMNDKEIQNWAQGIFARQKKENDDHEFISMKLNKIESP